MADFELGMIDLDTKEGRRGVVDHPLDRGGMTWGGIARNYHPDWTGWEIIDRAAKLGRDLTVQERRAIDRLRHDFYRNGYWAPAGCDRVNNQAIANELFEQAVHQTPHHSTRRLQRVLNAMNRGEKRWPDLVVDGRFGNATNTALDAALAGGYADIVWSMLNHLQGVNRLEDIEQNPAQEAFSIGWFRRAMA